KPLSSTNMIEFKPTEKTLEIERKNLGEKKRGSKPYAGIDADINRLGRYREGNGKQVSIMIEKYEPYNQGKTRVYNKNIINPDEIRNT
ncbi:hypothetical protein U2044_15435, partial [Listeria monocytogenes]|uniref:hypothetical protein n=1 Tax=Listeria monocytogenes TaxID=1639 RepID=UPI002FDC2A36